METRNPKYAAILKREFEKASNLEVAHVYFDDDAETITVRTGKTRLYARTWVMQIGSDDDGFVFKNKADNSSVTFPFPQDWLDLEEDEGTYRIVEKTPAPTELDFIKDRLRRYVAESTAARTKLAAEIGKSDGDAIYAIQWLSGKVETLFEGQWAAEALTLLEEGKTVAEVKAILQMTKDNWTPEQSSSAFSNAVNLAKFNALRSMLTYSCL